MAIIRVAELFKDSASEGKDGWEFEKHWLVVTDGNADEYQVCNAPKIPRRGDKHKSGQSVVGSKHAERIRGDDVPDAWIVKVHYDPIEGLEDQKPGAGGKPEELFPPTIAFGTVTERVVFDRDFSGAVIRNPAGDAFKSLEPTNESQTTITISATIGFDLIDEKFVEAWRDRVHGPAFRQRKAADPVKEAAKDRWPRLFGHGPHKVKLTDFSARTTQKTIAGKEVTVWDASVQLTVARLWLGTQILEGTRRLVNGPFNPSEGVVGGGVDISSLRPIVDAQGVPVVRPVLMNANGDKLAPGESPVFLMWQKHPSGDLNEMLRALKLPTEVAGYKIIVKKR